MRIKYLKVTEHAHSVTISLFEEEFTCTELNRAMKKLKTHTSTDRDKTHNEMLINIGKTEKEVILT